MHRENRITPLNPSNTQPKVNQSGSKNSRSSNKYKCWFCKGNHKISDCIALKGTPIDKRRSLVKKNKLCFKCLSSDHMIIECPSKSSCKVTGCGKHHHTLVHKETLIHLFPMHPFSSSWKHQKTIRFSDVFKR